MKIQTALLALGLLSLPMTQALGASISVGDNLHIEAINGNTIDARNTYLGEGTYVVALKFSDIYVVNAEDFSWVRSGPLYTTVTIAPGEALTIATTELFSEHDAREFLNAPEVILDSAQREPATRPLLNQSQVIARLLQTNQ